VKALCIFPFEEKFYRDAGVSVEFIGHPLVGAVHATMDRENFCKAHGLDSNKLIVTILPGSRAAELRQHLPAIRIASGLIQKEVQAQFVVAAAPGSPVSALKQEWPADLAVRIVEGQTYDALAAADAAIISSGTATVEAAILDVPMVVVYRVTPLTALLAKPLVRTRFFSMVNLIAGRLVVPELIQKDFTPQRVASEILRLLRNETETRSQRTGLAEVREQLGPPGSVERAADAILRLIAEARGNAD
jgi:lipid-A-disaccharide synthase